MSVTRLRIGALVCVAMSVVGSGCVGPDGPAVGSLGVNLVGQAASGTVYRLRDARIAVLGPANKDWNSEDDPDQTSMSADVPVGDYSASLQDGWRLERLDRGSASPVTAQLISDNPARFTVAAMQRATVPLRFRVDAGEVDMAQGYDLVITVEEPQPPVVVIASTGYGPFFPAISLYPAGAQGDVAPLRRIAGGSTGLSSPRSLAILGDQMVVQNSLVDFDNMGSLAFYSVTASGDAAPARQIGGTFLSTISNSIDMATSNGEIYVLQTPVFSTNHIAVFPATAVGDVAPARALTLTLDTSQGDSPRVLAVGGGELYIASGPPNRIDVYPSTASGTATPTRTISVPDTGCPSGLVVQGGEIFVADLCSHDVRVFSAAASGAVAPLRVLAGADTGLRGPTKLAVFQGELYVCDFATNSVRVFPAGAGGNVAPTRVIVGPHTDLALPWGVAVF